MLHSSAANANLLLATLSVDDLQLLRPHLERIPLPRDKVLIEENAAIDDVYFPESGVASIVARNASGASTEVGIFGREGVSATCLLLGVDRAPHRTFMQVGGVTAMRIATDRYLAALAASSTLRTSLLRYVQTALVQSAQNTAANAHYRIEQRLARWLLMCHDRIDGDEIALTHVFMGMMIAAERSGVTVALHILEGEGLIISKRGRVFVRDRAGLERQAGDSYGLPEAEHRRLLGPFGKVAQG